MLFGEVMPKKVKKNIKFEIVLDKSERENQQSPIFNLSQIVL